MAAIRMNAVRGPGIVTSPAWADGGAASPADSCWLDEGVAGAPSAGPLRKENAKQTSATTLPTCTDALMKVDSRCGIGGENNVETTSPAWPRDAVCSLGHTPGPCAKPCGPNLVSRAEPFSPCRLEFPSPHRIVRRGKRVNHLVEKSKAFRKGKRKSRPPRAG
jgi:hypothetical protein